MDFGRRKKWVLNPRDKTKDQSIIVLYSGLHQERYSRLTSRSQHSNTDYQSLQLHRESEENLQTMFMFDRKFDTPKKKKNDKS